MDRNSPNWKTYNIKTNYRTNTSSKLEELGIRDKKGGKEDASTDSWFARMKW